MSCCEANKGSSSIQRGREILKELGENDNNALNVKGITDSDIKNLKNEGKIRIYFYGENLLKILIDKTSIEDNKITDKKSVYIKGYDKAFNWEYFIFEEITEENNSTISNLIEEDFNNMDFFDIIVITVKNILDEKSKLFFEYFQNFSKQRVKQPFILFISKEEENPNVEKLYDLITNEYFDKRTLYALKYPSLKNENETKNILEIICKFRNYFHEEGDSFESFNEEISTNYKFNILICGRAGTGKSTFINQFLGERKAKEGEGLSVTHKIVTYGHPKYPINISDTPGFENEETVKNVKILLDKYNKKLIDARKKINLILYFIPYDERSILSMEIPVLECLMEYKTEIIFVMNFVTESIEKKHYKRIKGIFEQSLKKITPPNFPITIYPINLKTQIDDEEDEDEEEENHKIKIIKSFGLDTLFQGIFNIFKSNIIEINDIKKIKSTEELIEFFRKNKLFNHYNQINDLFISFRSELSNLILSYGRLNRLSFRKEKNMEEMANLIFMKCTGKKCLNYRDYIMLLSSKNQVELLFERFTQNLDILKSYSQEIHTMFFYKSIHDHKTLALGYLCLNELEKLFESSPNIFVENDRLDFDLIYNLCNSYNHAINGFKLIADKYEKQYQEEYEKNKLIINKYKKNNEKDIKPKETDYLKDNIIDVNEKVKED